MKTVALLKKYQGFDPVKGSFGDLRRTNREYAAMLGVHETYLSKCYEGLMPTGIKVLRGLVRVFPTSANEIAAALLADSAAIPA